jgi:hypothetical protein
VLFDQVGLRYHALALWYTCKTCCSLSVRMQGAELLYSARGCFSQLKDECQPASSPFYRFTTTGIDQMLKEFYFSVESLLLQSDAATNMSTELFQYIYEVGDYPPGPDG